MQGALVWDSGLEQPQGAFLAIKKCAYHMYNVSSTSILPYGYMGNFSMGMGEVLTL